MTVVVWWGIVRLLDKCGLGKNRCLVVILKHASNLKCRRFFLTMRSVTEIISIALTITSFSLATVRLTTGILASNFRTFWRSKRLTCRFRTVAIFHGFRWQRKRMSGTMVDFWLMTQRSTGRHATDVIIVVIRHYFYVIRWRHYTVTSREWPYWTDHWPTTTVYSMTSWPRFDHVYCVITLLNWRLALLVVCVAMM